MDSKFGVNLKTTGSSGTDKAKVGAGQSKLSNVNDIKTMFDGDKSSVSNLNLGTDYKEKVKTSRSVEGKSDDLSFFSQFKFNIDVNKNTTMEVTGEEDRLSRQKESVPTKVVKVTDSVDSLQNEPQCVKSKVYSGNKPFQASKENKFIKQSESENKGLLAIDKQQASSSLQAHLAILRTRPGSGGSKNLQTGTNLTEATTTDKKQSTQTSVDQPWKKSAGTAATDCPKPWIKKTDNESTTSRIKAWEQTKHKMVEKSESSSSDKRLSGNLSPRSKDSGQDFGLALNKKTEDSSPNFRSNYSRQSSSESSASSISSPRLSIRKSMSNVSPTTRSFSPVNLRQQISEEPKPEWMNKSKELVGKFQTKLKKPTDEISESSTNNRPNEACSSHSVGSRSATKTNTTTTTRLVSSSNVKGDASWRRNEPPTNSKPTGKVTAKLTKEPLRNRESLPDSDSSSSSVDIKAKQYVARKMSSEQLQRIKGKFENDSSEQKTQKPKLEIHTAKNLLERKDSLEKLKSPEIKTDKCKTLKSLQQDGKLPKIRDRISALNQGQGEIVRARISSSESSDKPAEEYHDIEGFEVYQEGKGNDWPTTSESEDENMYEYIPATDPSKVSSTAHKRTSSVPNRRLGLKRKGNVRPSFDTNEPNDSSSELTTSSKEGTMESIDDRAAVDADVEEYNSDSSNSGIYEPISGDIARLIKSHDVGSQEDLPPQLPPDRVKKKNKKGIFKQFKQKLQQPKSNTDPTLSKVSSAPALTGSGSTGLLKKVGKMMKRNKSSDNQTTAFGEEFGVCQSEDSSDNQEESIYEDEPIHMKPCQQDIPYIDHDELSAGSDYEDEISSKADCVVPPPPPRPPPPPPPSGPPLPPRISTASSGKHLTPSPQDDDIQPVLPPRNRVSGNFSLETVVPIGQGVGSPPPCVNRNSFTATKDSYLHGHHVLDNRLSSTSSSDESHLNQDDYIKPDPPTGIRPDSEDQALPIPPALHRNKGKEPLDKRPSSGYVKYKDVCRQPEGNAVTAPFNHLMMYKSQLQLDKEDEEELYIDLSNDSQLYGSRARRYSTKFESEPLYQCYHRDMISRSSAKNTAQPSCELSDEETESGDSIYEVLPDIEELEESNSKPDRPKLSTLEMFGKTGSVLRALWCEMPEVKESGILDSVTSHERKIQESMFEIITSEASYLKSLNVLIDVFLMSQEFSSEHSHKCVITRQERHVLFSNVGAVREASEKFLSDLEERWQQSVFITDICDIIQKNASQRFECYVRYCSNQTFQERATQELMKRPEFEEAVRRLERDPMCQGLPMISFLLLPMQRITRLPLLVDAICHRLDPATERHRSAKKALDALNRVVRKCNDGARRMQQTEQMCHLVQNLEFKVKEIPLISASRYLVKQGELTRVMTEASKGLFGKGKASKQSVFVYLFNDIFLISKRKGNNIYSVTDYANRNAVHVENIEHPEKGFKNLFRVVLLENYDQRQVEMVFSCKSTSDKSRWIDALSPAATESENEKIYEEWDCPQVQCIRNYSAQEPDELTLEESDVVNVFKKMTDGWYEGERIRDGERGWFPANCTVEIVNSHVRARNLRLRYRLMQASEEFREVYNKAKS
ncbi:hypothetical protein FSP39_004312 [Pinctada imbricata]|uniref:Uncharacterized protein n=1 Tax=Pinctada imbricata TaxID=66713 RepID=A0AA88YHB0_PINIB|nr:hypothetical protein FSP39_004312 [Pinctada imbricata]